jgi:DNA-binding NtrC family response regulator/Tfp pilus assembly protein PilF
MLNCTSCRQRLPLGSESCAECGTKVTGAAAALARGIRAFADSSYEAALSEFQRARQIVPGDADVLRCYAHGLRHAGRLDSAMAAYRDLLVAAPDDVEARFGTAMILIEWGRLGQARKFFEDLVRVPLPFVQGTFYLGLLYDAPEGFRSDCYYHIAIACWNLGETDAAGHYFEQALELNPNHAGACRHLGNLRFQAQQYSEAVELYQRYLHLHHEDTKRPENFLEVKCNAGIAYFEGGEVELAMDYLNQVLRDRPGHPGAIYHMNLIYEREGMYPRKSVVSPASFEDTDGASMIFGLSGAQETANREVLAHKLDPSARPIIGKSIAMQRVLRHARLAAASDATVLLMGENGTGKELIARAVHEHSNRRDRPFVPVNCAAIPESLIESELFGHERGAFTGATELRKGRFEIANEGTIFLDEVGELDLNMQVKLLRFLQEREINRVGGNESIHIDVRIIAATNRDLEEMLEERTFRQDLYFRLNVLPIQLPPLRERKEDIPMLVDFFLQKYGKGSVPKELIIQDEDLGVMMDYAWPGNIRELENVIERALVLGTQVTPILQGIARGRRTPPSAAPDAASARPASGESTASDREGHVRESGSPFPDGEWKPLSIRDLERLHILQTLSYTEGNRTEAARILGINPSTLWRKMKSYDIPDE